MLMGFHYCLGGKFQNKYAKRKNERERERKKNVERNKNKDHFQKEIKKTLYNSFHHVLELEKRQTGSNSNLRPDFIAVYYRLLLTQFLLYIYNVPIQPKFST